MSDKKLKILLVDDDMTLREMYAEIFHNANYEVLEANDGVEGLDLASKEIPDVIFTGIVMPRMDGFTMMESLKKTVMTANIPVVISSHMGREEDHQRANMLGAKDFIIRDITQPVEVLERISSLFKEKNENYRIGIDMSGDAQKLAKDLNLQPDFSCPSCQEKMVLDLKLKDASKQIFEARLLCPKCGWSAE
jgi:CheY-like chemotaxis protein/predicted RNA-binding Zn-ribbon protein involved in translation (DUF1610 family)